MRIVKVWRVRKFVVHEDGEKMGQEEVDAE